MCGIGGVSLVQGKAADAKLLGRLACALAHRGPDGEGLYSHKGTGLVHRRLSIIDLAGGAQPISTADGQWHIVCNGEIYNYQPLRRGLVDQGYSFTTHSDSEVALHLYRTHGLDFVKHLEGMYALAIYDQAADELVLARDPVGIKPLYISATGKGLAFASEAGALVRAGWVAGEVNPAAWPSLFNRQYVGGQQTLFAGVERVKPGEVLRIRHGKVVERRMYPLSLGPVENISEAEALEVLDSLLHEAVQSHLQSEVPYGAFLSGGIDSSTVVSRMAELTDTVRTYTIGFSSTSVADERATAFSLARRLHTQHTAVDFGEQDFWHQLPRMCAAVDDLVADYATLPTLKLAEHASKEVKVILSGEGGDEGFAGYGRYRRGGLLDTLRGRTFRGRGDTAGYKQLFHDGAIPAWRGGDTPRPWDEAGFTRLQGYQARDMADWLPDDLLIKVDRALMVHGIEGRVPLLDRKLLSFAFSLPDGLKVQRKKGKYLLKKWLEGHQPQLNVWAPKKGFTVPVQPWLEAQRHLLLPYLHRHGGVAQVLVRKDLRRWLENPLDKRGAKLLFSVLCYALWHDIYIQGRVPGEGLLDQMASPAEDAA